MGEYEPLLVKETAMVWTYILWLGAWFRLHMMWFGGRGKRGGSPNISTGLIGQFDPLLEDAHRRKLQWVGHTTRRQGSLASDGKLQENEEGQKELGSQTLHSGRRLPLQHVCEQLKTGRCGGR